MNEAKPPWWVLGLTVLLQLLSPPQRGSPARCWVHPQLTGTARALKIDPEKMDGSLATAWRDKHTHNSIKKCAFCSQYT